MTPSHLDRHVMYLIGNRLCGSILGDYQATIDRLILGRMLDRDSQGYFVTEAGWAELTREMGDWQTKVC